MNDAVKALIDLLNGRFGDVPSMTEADWQQVIVEAQRHGVAQAIYVLLKENDVSLSPLATQKLRDIYLAGVSRNMLIFHYLVQVLKTLEAAHIPVIPLKGVHLAANVYDNMALRQMGDVDLLFKLEDLPRALEILQADGYVSMFSMEGRMGYGLHLPPMSKPGGFTLEAHWTIALQRSKINFGDADIAGIWTRANGTQIAGINTLVLAPEDLLLYLCLHISVHHYFKAGLIKFLDIKEVIAHHNNEIRWDQFIARAHQWGIAGGVHLTLLLAREWTNAAVPESVMDALQPVQPDAEVYEWVRRKVLDGTPPAMASNVIHLEGRHLRDKLSAVWGSLFQSRHSMATMYSVPADSWRIFFYYLVRFKDLWGRWHREIWKLLRRDRTLVAQARKEIRLREWLLEHHGK